MNDVGLHIPANPELLKCMGTVSIVHGHLDLILRRTVKTLAGLTVEEGDDATASMSTAQVRKVILKLGRQKLGEGEALLRLRALMQRCRRASELRNDYIHGLFAKELDGPELLRGRDHKWRAPPSVDELSGLATELQSLWQALNQARLEGFILEGLQARSKFVPKK